ncbi:MAG: hypothetical protein ACLQMH_03920 [Solirubrobacteraceae bacterium]
MWNCRQRVLPLVLATACAAPATAAGAAYDPEFSGVNGLLTRPRVPPPQTLFFSGSGWAVSLEQGDGGCSQYASIWLTREPRLGPYTIARVRIAGPAHTWRGHFKFSYTIMPGRLAPGWRTFNATNGWRDGQAHYTTRSVRIRVC